MIPLNWARLRWSQNDSINVDKIISIIRRDSILSLNNFQQVIVTNLDDEFSMLIFDRK